MALPSFNGIALCAGAGGLELGLHIAEPRYRTVCYVEREAYAAATLVARMEDAALDPAPVWDNVKTFDGRPWRDRVDILSAGYPCQPFSSAGKRRGTKDPRHLWPDIARIVDEAQPEWLFLENVPHHLRVGFPVVGGDLRSMGFRFVAGLHSARETGAAHFRRRLFILAHRDGDVGGRLAGAEGDGGDDPHGRSDASSGVAPGGAHLVVDVGSDRDRRRREIAENAAQEPPLFAPGPRATSAWYRILRRDPGLKPAFRRNADGMAGRLDRQPLAGNGVFPMAAALAFLCLRTAFDDGLKEH